MCIRDSYDTIACGVLLGFVFSYYKDSAYSWIDNALGSHILDEQTLKTMVWTMCKGRVTTDYPVSYTHLDVYKRQELYKNMPKAIGRDPRFAWDAAGENVSIKV